MGGLFGTRRSEPPKYDSHSRTVQQAYSSKYWTFSVFSLILCMVDRQSLAQGSGGLTLPLPDAQSRAAHPPTPITRVRLKGLPPAWLSQPIRVNCVGHSHAKQSVFDAFPR